MIDWLNNNSGAIMALLTLVYVIATIVICIFNYKSAKATREQTIESIRQFEESNKAHIVPKIIEVEGEMLCLSIQNIGNSIADKVKISVNESWLKKLETTHTFPEVANSLRKLKKSFVFLTIDQSLCYGLCIPGNGYDDFKKISETDLKINVKYFSNNKSYEENFVIPLSSYNYMVNISDYARLTKKQIKASNEIKNELKKINDTLKK